jgi:hypothetical protein
VRTIANVRLVLWLSSLLPHFVCFFSLCLLVSIYRFYSLLISVSLPLYLNFSIPLQLSVCLPISLFLCLCHHCHSVTNFSICLLFICRYIYFSMLPLHCCLSNCLPIYFVFFLGLSLYVSAWMFCVSLSYRSVSIFLCLFNSSVYQSIYVSLYYWSFCL